jgi:DNA-directed RNA polymerase subunit RPC12/RpoP
MKQGPFAFGIIMILAGVYSFWMYFQILWNGSFMEDIALWIITLVTAIMLISFGPGVIAWSFVTSSESAYRQIAKQKQLQVIQIPLQCSECQNEISIRSLEWIEDDEVRCPFCSKDLEIRTSRSYM